MRSLVFSWPELSWAGLVWMHIKWMQIQNVFMRNWLFPLLQRRRRRQMSVGCCLPLAGMINGSALCAFVGPHQGQQKDIHIHIQHLLLRPYLYLFVPLNENFYCIAHQHLAFSATEPPRHCLPVFIVAPHFRLNSPRYLQILELVAWPLKFQPTRCRSTAECSRNLRPSQGKVPHTRLDRPKPTR